MHNEYVSNNCLVIVISKIFWHIKKNGKKQINWEIFGKHSSSYDNSGNQNRKKYR